MKNAIKIIEKYGVVPTSVIDKLECALPMADALIRGGLPLVEVTLRTSCALDVIKTIKEKRPEILVGAGTVLTVAAVKEARAAGAEFVVSPGFNKKVVKYCLKKKIPIIPGCITPSEIEAALEMGLTRLKFFPGVALGGVETISQMCAPYADVKVLVTGGITGDNISEFLSCDKVFAVGAGYIVRRDIVNDAKFDEVEAQALTAVTVQKNSKVGVN